MASIKLIFRYSPCTSWRASFQEIDFFMNGCYVDIKVWNEYLYFSKMDTEWVCWSTFSVLPRGKLQGHPLEVKEQKLQITGCVHIKAHKTTRAHEMPLLYGSQRGGMYYDVLRHSLARSFEQQLPKLLFIILLSAAKSSNRRNSCPFRETETRK